MANRNVEALAEPLKVGNTSTGDYTEIQEDGTIKSYGDATTWDDIVGSLIGRRLFSNTGTIDYDYDENALVFQRNGNIGSTNDRLIFNYQYPHAAVSGGSMNLHIHWEQENSSTLEFTVQYRVQENGVAKTTTWTEVVVSTATNNVFTYTSGTLNQITKLVDVDVSEAGLSATVQFRVTRSDSVDTEIKATFIDAHIARDMTGSASEFIK